jgi:hypothetical protein
MRPSEKSYLRAIELRQAVREAERRVADAWSQAPRSQTVDSPEVKAWEVAPPHKPRLHPLAAAKQIARAAARAEVRARWAAEDAEQITLPSQHHPARTKGMTNG